jgi:hypothetical protein
MDECKHIHRCLNLLLSFLDSLAVTLWIGTILLEARNKVNKMQPQNSQVFQGCSYVSKILTIILSGGFSFLFFW